MLSHRRGRSLSDALTLEQSEEGRLVVSSINNNASANQGLREGDEILGATINFDQLSKEEVLNVLKLMEPFNDKIQMLTRSNLSKSLGNLDQCAKDPETMLKDSYSKLYNAKIKKFMRGDLHGDEEINVNGEATVKTAAPSSSKVNLKHMGLPRLGVDFGLLKTKTVSTDVNADSQSDDTGELTCGSNLNLPPLGLGSNGTALIGAQVPKLKVDARSLQLNTPDSHLSRSSPEGVNVSSASTELPNMIDGQEISGASFNGPQSEVKTPHVGTPDVPSGKLSFKCSKRLKNPDLNVDDPTSYAELPKLRLSRRSPDLDLEMPSAEQQLDLNGLEVDMPSSALKVPLKKTKIDLKSPDLDVDASSGKFTAKTSDVSLKNPKIKGGIQAQHVNLPKADLKGPNLTTDTPSTDIKGPSGKYKAPKFIMPKFDLPEIQVPDINGDLAGPNIRLAAPDLKAGTAGQNADLNLPSTSEKLKLPGFGLSGPKVKGTEYELKTPDMDVSTPTFERGVNLHSGQLKDPNLDLSTPDVDINMPFGKLDDADVPSGKLKLPKFKLFGTLPKKKDVDINAGMKTPELTMKPLKVNGSFNGPDMDINVPSVNLKGPKADLEMPHVDMSGSLGKLKKPNLNMPDLGLSGPKLDGPSLDIKSPDLDISGSNLNGGINTPDINMPNIDLSSPKLDLGSPELNMDMPSGKVKMPELHAPDWNVNAPSGKLKLPKFNVSGTLPKGPNLDLNTDIKSPDLSLEAPKIKGGINAPNLNLPNMNLKAPKLDVNSPNVNLGSPKAKLKMPKLKMPKIGLPSLKGPEIDGGFDGPDIDINAPDVNFKGSKPGFEMPDVDFGNPSGKFKKPHFKMPDVGFSSPKLDGPNFDLKSPNLNAKLPKGPNLNVNSDLKTPDFHFKTPKIEGEIDSPKLGPPNMDLKVPKLELNNPDVNIGFPDTKFKMPKMPKGPNVNIDGDLQGPDLNTPNLDVNGPKGKFKMPTLNAPDLSISELKAKTPDIDLSGPKLKGPAISMPDLPDSGFKGPKLDLSAKRPAPGINSNIGKPDMDLTAPQVKGEIRGPDFDINVPSGNIQGPHTNFDMADRKIKLPSFKLPQFGSPDLNRTGSDIDFGASLRPKNMDISPPNAKLNMKPAGLKGNITGPNVSAPNIHLSMPKAAMQNPQLHFKNPDLNIDDPSLIFKGPSYKNRRSDITGANMRMPALDVDGPVRHSNTNKKSPRTKVRASYPLVDAHLGHNIDFNRLDLNIDDFTEKDHVLRARGSTLDLQSSHNYRQVISPSGVNISMKGPRHARTNSPGNSDIYAKPQRTIKPISNAHIPHFSQGSRTTVPDSTDGYYVTVFPSQAQNQKMPNRKHSTLGWPDFHPRDMDLEVPSENDVKGSTFVFSNLV